MFRRRDGSCAIPDPPHARVVFVIFIFIVVVVAGEIHDGFWYGGCVAVAIVIIADGTSAGSGVGIGNIIIIIEVNAIVVVIVFIDPHGIFSVIIAVIITVIVVIVIRCHRRQHAIAEPTQPPGRTVTAKAAADVDAATHRPHALTPLAMDSPYHHSWCF